jgi:hypothetical protein
MIMGTLPVLDVLRKSIKFFSLGIRALRLPDPDKELRHLSKNLKLKKDQRAGDERSSEWKTTRAMLA